jgi:glutathione S-transferase
MLLLFEHPLSPYAQKCKIALREKGVPFEARLPAGVGVGSGFEPAFLEASPRGEVPALVDGEVRVFDSTIILDYIEERWPAPPLLPAAPAERFGRADLSVVPYLNGSRGFGLQPEAGSRLADWLARANERPAVAQTAAEAGGFLSGGGGGMGQIAELLAKGLFKREYRDHRLEWMVRSGGVEVVLEGLERQNIRFTSEFD